MITFALRCEPGGHDFDGWFRSGEDFEKQAKAGAVECPVCGATVVNKALMAPSVSGIGQAGPPPDAAAALARLHAMTREMRAKSDYVGRNFAEEARRMHYGETEARGIYGEATLPQVKSLAEEGIRALPMPSLPEDKN